MKRRSLLPLLCLGALPLMAAAQSSTPIRILVPLGPGTPSDSVTRMLAPALSQILGQPVIVDNKPGANGIIAVQELMRAKPDGTTLLMGSVSPLAINMALVKNMPYDPRRDLTAIGGTYNAAQAWVVRSSSPLKSMADLLASARQQPGKVSAAHYSALTQIQLSAFSKMTGAELLMVPYKSTATAYTDTLSGTVDVTIMDMATAAAQIRGGTVRALGLSAVKAHPLTPGVPPVAETVADFDFASWSAFVGPAGMPRDVVVRLNAALVQVIRQRDIEAKMIEAGLTPWTSTPEELTARIGSEVTKWTRLAHQANIQAE